MAGQHVDAMHGGNLIESKLTILLSLVFYPRGGSAQVVRYLSRALVELGHDVHLVAGTLRDGDPEHDARVFYRDLPVTTVDYTEAWEGFTRGENPFAEDWLVPFHPSYEDKPDVPDRVFYKVASMEYAALVRSWRKVFQSVRRRLEPDVLHLHHANHMHIAAARVFPSVPTITQLHGTELKMLEHLASETSATGIPGETRVRWRDLLTESIQSVQHIVAISPDVRQRALVHFPIAEHAITTIPNAVDTTLFAPGNRTDEQKLSLLREILVENPRGWDESGVPGSIRYSERDLDRFATNGSGLKPLVIFVGRFLGFKRVPLLIRAVSRVNDLLGDREAPPFNVLIWGGMPGEWEDEHPHTVARAVGVPNVFFTGWLPHAILSQGLHLADLFVAPSYQEAFGLVYLEAMATGLPVIATRSGGPPQFVVDSGNKANGWLCDVDDEDGLAQVMYEALTNEAERARRGGNALQLVRDQYDWTSIAQRYVELYRRLTG